MKAPNDCLGQIHCLFRNSHRLPGIGVIEKFPRRASADLVAVVCLNVDIRPQQFGLFGETPYVISFMEWKQTVAQGLSKLDSRIMRSPHRPQ